ncbi:MAG: hypothetical protein QOE97_2313 [Pseudonocardiales bacterium]|jgi:hypothetical protein|nr:hypothetical protein [Pseudonocardiales bacterium]
MTADEPKDEGDAGREDHPTGDVDPMDFARAMLHISPEDAAKVRERSPATRPRRTAESDNRQAADTERDE